MVEAMRTAIILPVEYLRTGGLVMLPLVGVSLLMWWLIAERVLCFRRLHRDTMTAALVKDCLAQNRAPSVKQCRGATGLVVAAFLARQSGRPTLDRAIVDEIIQQLNRCLTHRLALIGVLAAVAPLLGLLGTVTGMVATFDVLAVFGTGNVKAMAAGISQALITTQTGLLVAIPGLYMKGFLDRRARTLGQRIASTGLYLKRQIK